MFCTEYCRGKYKYRCHPRYGNRGGFYDWFLVQFEDGKLYPCKLIACVPVTYKDFEGYEVIVQVTTKKLKRQDQCYLKNINSIQN